MNRNKDVFEASGESLNPGLVPPGERMSGDELDLHVLARSEGWHVPPPEVTRVVLRPWQQAVFWGLRAYIVVMLAVMAVGFAKVAGGP